MRPYYITKRANGYYRIRLIDQKTGLITCDKSSHTKDRSTAESIAVDWMIHGVPEGMINARKDKPAPSPKKAKESELDQLMRLAKKYGVTVVLPQSVAPEASEMPVIAQNTPQPASLPDYEPVQPVSQTPAEKTPSFPDDGLDVCAFLTDFWDETKSEYIQKKRAKGKGLANRHCKDMRDIVRRYWKPYFDTKKICELDFNCLEDFFFYLKTELNKSSSTVNKAINVAAVAFDFEVKHGRLGKNPMTGIDRYGADTEKRGILSVQEVEKLFSAQWDNPVSRLANMLAATTGMRAGEISGLRYCDLGEDRIFINHAWGVVDGLKSTKTGKKREVPVLPDVIYMLKRLARRNPVYSDSSFVFWSPVKGGKEPFLPRYWEDGLYDTLAKIGISKEQRVERNIVFHSWRHFYATQISERAQASLAQETLGHASAQMTAHYASHGTEEKMAAVQGIMREVTKNVLIMPEQYSA
ncbi:MAG: site-specific integrase [Treponema sp.]|nr:site-specific integrase [Treponema sp.]